MTVDHAEAEKTVLPPKRQPNEVPSLMDSGIPHGNPDFYFDPRTSTCPPNESSAVSSRVSSLVFGLGVLPAAAVPGIRTEVVRGSEFVGVDYDLDFRPKKAVLPNQLSAPPLIVESYMRGDLIQLDDFVSSLQQDNPQGVTSQEATVSPQTVISQQGALPPQEQGAPPPSHDTSEPMSPKQTAGSNFPHRPAASTETSSLEIRFTKLWAAAQLTQHAELLSAACVAELNWAAISTLSRSRCLRMLRRSRTRFLGFAALVGDCALSDMIFSKFIP